MQYSPESMLPEAIRERAVVALQASGALPMNMPQSEALAAAALDTSGALQYIASLRNTLEACLLREDVASDELGKQIRDVLGRGEAHLQG